MEQPQLSANLPYSVGALYNRRQEIHGRLGGQMQGGISTPANSPFVILFTGEAGKQHGYHDFWDDNGVLHYYGEGQSGDMQDRGGNRAIREHQQNGKRLLLFQMMGRAQPYRFLGEFRFRHAYSKDGVPDTSGGARTAIVFMLEPVERDFNPFQNVIADRAQPQLDLSATASLQLVEIRSKQSLFKRRLLTVEKSAGSLESRTFAFSERATSNHGQDVPMAPNVLMEATAYYSARMPIFYLTAAGSRSKTMGRS
jgi:5-methylcytosine-specific restriction enzyme A